MAEDGRDEFTFNDLSSLLRVEKSSGTLSDVRNDLYPSIIELMESLDRECEKIAHINPDSLFHDGAIEKRRKANQNVKRLIETRMNKVALLALRGAIGAQISIEHLPPEEKDYYERILVASKVHWGSIDRKKKTVVIPDISSIEEKPAVVEKVPEPIVHAPAVEITEETALEDMPYFPDDEPMVAEEQMPDIDEELLMQNEGFFAPVEETVVEESPVEAAPAEKSVVEEPVIEEITEDPEPAVVEEEEVYTEDDESFTTIIVSESLPVFSGPEREYRLNKGDLVKMPTVMANVLINRNMAMKVKI